MVIVWGIEGVLGALVFLVFLLVCLLCMYGELPPRAEQRPVGRVLAAYWKSAAWCAGALFSALMVAAAAWGACHFRTVDFTVGEANLRYGDDGALYVDDGHGDSFNTSTAVWDRLDALATDTRVSCRATDPLFFVQGRLLSCRRARPR